MRASSLTHLTIANVSEQLFMGEVSAVSIPGTEGVMTLLAHHAALITLLRPGTIIVSLDNGEKKDFSVTGGTVEVSNNQITILI
jgi:F-type H+-transporting ATPase subunit epsilon